MHRADITDTLVHFTSADSNAQALEILWRIIYEGRLLGSNRLIKGGFTCVCFTETPLELVRETLLDAEETGHRYKPFGVAIKKRWLFERGGRPVAYQRDEEFEQLAEPSRWRHMRYEPNGNPPVDFTWEREWRLHAPQLDLDPDKCTLVVPDAAAEAELSNRHYEEEYTQSELRALEQPGWYTAGDGITPFPWHVYRLS